MLLDFGGRSERRTDRWYVPAIQRSGRRECCNRERDLPTHKIVGRRTRGADGPLPASWWCAPRVTSPGVCPSVHLNPLDNFLHLAVATGTLGMLRLDGTGCVRAPAN